MAVSWAETPERAAPEIPASGLMVRLHCYPCSTLHEFTPGEVERIVYCLQGWLGDALTERPVTEVDGCDCAPCLCEVLDASRESDGGRAYGEWTDGLIELRENRTRFAEASHGR